MRFLLTLMVMLLSVGVFAKYSNPKVEAMLAEAEGRLTDALLTRYSEPGDAKLFEPLLRAMKRSPAEIGAPSEDVYTPIQVHENGETSVALQAGQGWISDDFMTLRGKDVKIFSYHADGTLESTIFANEVLVDRHTMRAVMRGKVSIQMASETIQGNGALANFDTQYIRILGQAKITTSRLSDAQIDTTTL
jgi:lipopolysaccharide export system protein LptC